MTYPSTALSFQVPVSVWVIVVALRKMYISLLEQLRFLLTDFRLHNGFQKECTQVHVFRPRLMAFNIDNPIAHRLSRISNRSAMQDLPISPTSSSISRTRESRIPAPYFPLSSFNSATNQQCFAAFSLATIYPTNLARKSPVTACS